MKWMIGLATIAIAVVLTIGIRSCGPGGSGILDHLSLPDGSEYVLTQKWNGITEPYTVSFYFREEGGEWGWCYIDHEDTRWHRGELRYDPDRDSVEVLKGSALRAELQRTEQTFALYSTDERKTRELPAPQEQRAPEFPVND